MSATNCGRADTHEFRKDEDVRVPLGPKGLHWACPVCGDDLDDCYDDDPGWMLCRGDDEWSGYWDDLEVAWTARRRAEAMIDAMDLDFIKRIGG